MARLSKPFPPGRYPVIVVGSGPGALQTSYFLKRQRIKHAVLSADPGPAGMFRRFPFFDRLISWSKPFPPDDYATAPERFDWNSLLAFNPHHSGLVTKEMDGTSYFPRRSEMQRGLERFASVCKIAVRYRCHWVATRRDDGVFTLTTSAGEYQSSLLVVGLGVTQPWLPDFNGVEHVTHYVDLKKPSGYAGRRVFIIGKRNSGFETANGLLPWASRIIMASPSPVHFSIHARHPSAARAIYMQPYEDHVLGGGHYVLDAVPLSIERTAGALRVRLAGTTIPGRSSFEVDDVIGATGFQTPLECISELGVATFGRQRLPALNSFWESVSVRGVHFVGALSQGASGITKYGRASSSGVVHGFRHNARVLAAHIAAAHFGRAQQRLPLRRRDLQAHLLNVAATDGALWNQQAYLARVIEFDKSGVFDVGLQPLAHFLDSAGPPALAITIETDDTGDIHPAFYARGGSRIKELILGTGPLLECDTRENRSELRALLGSRPYRHAARRS